MYGLSLCCANLLRAKAVRGKIAVVDLELALALPENRAGRP